MKGLISPSRISLFVDSRGLSDTSGSIDNPIISFTAASAFSEPYTILDSQIQGVDLAEMARSPLHTLQISTLAPSGYMDHL